MELQVVAIIILNPVEYIWDRNRVAPDGQAVKWILPPCPKTSTKCWKTVNITIATTLSKKTRKQMMPRKIKATTKLSSSPENQTFWKTINFPRSFGLICPCVSAFLPASSKQINVFCRFLPMFEYDRRWPNPRRLPKCFCQRKGIFDISLIFGPKT